MATFTWTIPTCEHVIADGGIKVVHWRCTATQTAGTGDDAVTYTDSSYGTVGLTYDASASDFIAYDSVTEANAQSWVWANGVDQSETEANLQNLIDQKVNPVDASGVPWSS